MTILDQKIIDGANLAARELNIEGVTPHFIASWWTSENGHQWDSSTNNPGNISFLGSGVPSTGLFVGVTSVNDNKTVNYNTPEDGIRAFVELIKIPKGKDKALTFDASDLAACGGDPEKLAKVIGDSNWAESHYDDGRGNGSLILDVYQSPFMIDAFKNQTPSSPHNVETTNKTTPQDNSVKDGQIIHVIASGETLTGISANYHVPMMVLARYNSIEDPNEIEAGAILRIPKAKQIRSGDTVTNYALLNHESVSFITKVNDLADENKIYVGQTLWV